MKIEYRGKRYDVEINPEGVTAHKAVGVNIIVADNGVLIPGVTEIVETVTTAAGTDFTDFMAMLDESSDTEAGIVTYLTEKVGV